MSFPQSSHSWFGTWPVMLTPMREDRSVDFKGLDALTDYHINSGCTGLFACCGSSEVYQLDDKEKIDIARAVLRRAAGRVPVVVGAIGQGDEPSRMQVARQLAELGATCVVLVTGEFAGPNEPEDLLCERLERFAEAAPGVPFGLYECPQPYHRLLSPAAVGRLAHTGRFIWLKETSRDPVQQKAKIKAMQGTSCCLFNANNGLLRQALTYGATGHSGTAANFSTLLASALCRPDADAQQATAWLNALMAIHNLVVPDWYLVSAKTCMRLRGLPITTTCRKDCKALSVELTDRLTSLFAAVVASEDEVLRSGLLTRANPCV